MQRSFYLLFGRRIIRLYFEARKRQEFDLILALKVSKNVCRYFVCNGHICKVAINKVEGYYKPLFAIIPRWESIGIEFSLKIPSQWGIYCSFSLLIPRLGY